MLTPEQIKELDIASQRKLNNWVSSEQSKEKDIKNLDYATKNGYVYKPVSDTPVPINNLSAETVKVGMSSPDIVSNLPDNTASNEALKVYNQGTLEDNKQTSDSIQKQIDTIKQAQIKDAQFKIEQANKASKDYNANIQPVIDNYNQDLSNKRNAINSVYTPEYYTSLLNDKKSITDEIIGYSKLLDGALNDVSMPSLASVATGRKNAVIADYQARMSVKQAALSAIDGNFSLASSILENGVAKLDDFYTKQLNFNKLAQEIFKTSDVKELTDKAIVDLEAKKTTLDATKSSIEKLLSDPTTAPVVQKAGILLTDTADEVATKLNNFYAKNPGYNPENIKANQALIQKYGDAGITPYDTADIVKSKLSKSQLYQKDILALNQSLDTNGQRFDTNGNLIPAPSKTGTIADRTNNPGNIKWGTFAQSMGAVDSGIKATDGGTFALFPDAETGFNVMKTLLTGSPYANLTLDKAMKRWSNNGYGAEVWNSDYASNKMNTITGSLLDNLVKAMAKREGWTGSTTTQTNSSDKSVAQMLVDGDMLIGDLSQRLGKNISESERVKYIKLAQQIDPNFSPNTNKARYNLQKRWESGDLWNNRVAINTALGHLADLKTAADNLLNTDLVKYNSLKNMLSKEVGNPEIAEFEINLNLLSEELAKIYKGGNAAPTEKEMMQMKDAILSSYSPKQFSGVANKTTELLSSRLTSLATAYKSTMGKNPSDIIDLDKIEMLRNAGIDISKIENGTGPTNHIDNYVNELTGINPNSISNYLDKLGL